MEETVKYAFRKSAMEKALHFELLDEGFAMAQEGRSTVFIPYQHIQRIQIFYQPFRYRMYNYACIIHCRNIPITIYSTTYASFANFLDLRDTYTPFVSALVQRKNAVNYIGKVLAGNTSFTYYGYIALTAFVIVGLSVVFSLFPLLGTVGFVFNLLLIIYYLSYIIKMFKVNYPRAITNGIVPQSVLPEV